MREKPTEDDLLDLVEGRLPSDRVAILRAALAEDRELLARVEAMVRDRRALRAEAPDRPRAPAGLVESAMERAEREALLGPAAGDRVLTPSPHGRRPIMFGALAAAAVVALAAGIALSIRAFSNSTRAEHVVTPGATEVGPPVELASDEQPVKEIEIPVIRPEPKADPTIDAWTREIAAKSGLDESEATGSPAWLTDDAVKLALAGRLKLVIPGGAPILAAADPSTTPSTVSEALEQPRRVPVRYRAEDGESGLRAALAALPGRLASAPAGAIVAEDAGGAMVPSVGLSLEPEDVAWWAQPPASWSRYACVYVLVAPSPRTAP